MNNYKVTIFLMVDAGKDENTEKPKLRKSVHFVTAENEFKAWKAAEQDEKSLLSVYDYKVEENKK